MKVDYFNIPEITVSYKDKVKASERAIVKSSADASRIFREAHKDCMQHLDEVYAVFLIRANRILGIKLVSVGGLNGTVVDNRVILQTALKVNSSSICIAHNHPSGTTRPSHEDIVITKRLAEAFKFIGIHLIDHLIMTEESYTSFADEGLL